MIFFLCSRYLYLVSTDFLAVLHLIQLWSNTCQFHPLFFDVKGIEKGASYVLKQPITLEINVCLAYNDASKQVQVTDKDGNVGIPLDQFIKKD